MLRAEDHVRIQKVGVKLRTIIKERGRLKSRPLFFILNKLLSDKLIDDIADLLVILLLLILAFTSFRTGFIAMIPNVAPIAIIGGIMGYAAVNLDMITAMIMPMILGIAVDDTIHFTNHIKYHFELTGNYRSAVLNSYREIGKTMIMTTIILCAMFGIFLTSTMTVLVNIGWLSIVGLGSALIADYTLTPVLLFITKPFGKETK